MPWWHKSWACDGTGQGGKMQRYEYKVLPAPRHGTKSREARSTADRFALTLTEVMNDLGAQGWDYLRADTLPCDERAGLTGTRTTSHTLLVFRRPLPESRDSHAAAPLAAAPPPATAPRLGPATATAPGPARAIGPAD